MSLLSLINCQPVFPVEWVLLDLVEVVHVVRGVVVVRVHQVAEVHAVGHVEEGAGGAEVRAESHVRVHAVHVEAGPGDLVVDELALDQVASGHVGHAPQASPLLLRDRHVVGRAGVIA